MTRKRNRVGVLSPSIIVEHTRSPFGIAIDEAERVREFKTIV